MIGSDLSTLQKIILALALIGLAYLGLQAGPSQTTISAWRGGPQPKMLGGISGSASRSQQGRGLPGDPTAPYGNPLQSPRTVLTQGYGVGSHAPAEVWGGLDLAIDGDGDGEPDPEGTANAPVYATHSGIAQVKPDTWPAGNYLSITGERYKTAYAHLSRYAIQDGQQIRRGDIIGYVGSTGQSSGPHLHYEIWKDGQNVNPTDYGALEGAVR